MNRKTYPREQLIEKASLTEQDFVEIRQRRRSYNRLGFAYQIGFVKLLNRFPSQQPLEIVDELLLFTGLQLGVDSRGIQDYQRRRETIAEHQERIRSYLRLRRFGPKETRTLESFLFTEALRFDHASALLAQAELFLREQGILQPADSTLMRIIAEQRARARHSIFVKIVTGLPSSVSERLDALLDVRPAETASPIQAIKSNPRKASADAMISLTERLELIEATGVLGIDLSWLNGNYQRRLFHYVKQCSADRLRALSQPRRNAILVCFLWQSYRDAVDQTVDMFDKLISRTQTRAQNTLDEQMRRQRRMIRASLSVLKFLGDVILDESIAPEKLRDRIFTGIPRQKLETQIESLAEWVSGSKSDLFHQVIKHHSHLRKFSPAFVRALEFIQETEGQEPACLTALHMLKDMNAQNRRKLPEEASIDFVPERLRTLVGDDGRVNKRAWECALLVTVRDEIRSGNLAVQYSKRFGRFDDFFVGEEHWRKAKEAFFLRSGLPKDPGEVSDYLHLRLEQAYEQFLTTAPENTFATIDETGWHLSTEVGEKPSPEAQQQLDHLKYWLAQHMRRIKLPDLLIEVDNELGFTRHFISAARRSERTAEEVCVVLATIMDHGCNIGPYTMSQLIEGISYKQLKQVSDWQMSEETQRSALAELVQMIAGLDTARHWGEGESSASDGQRFALPRKVLQQTYSPRFSDFALEFYSFIADNYAPFYSTPIECTDRDAAFVLDGLLYNESELDLKEHYTDTHGYTEINFAAFAMLGRRFCPRIRGLHHQRIYRIDPVRDYGMLKPLVNRPDRTIDMPLIVEQWNRMSQFYISLETGHTTASVALKRLAAFSSKNRFYRANRELGRVFKTEFILHYMSQPQLRSRIRRGLLKVEQLHALARDVYYGRRGRINARELDEQINACNCLTLILACIIYWQAKEISRVVECCRPEQNGVDISLLEHISPIEWDNVVLYGDYVINRELIRLP